MAKLPKLLFPTKREDEEFVDYLKKFCMQCKEQRIAPDVALKIIGSHLDPKSRETWEILPIKTCFLSAIITFAGATKQPIGDVYKIVDDYYRSVVVVQMIKKSWHKQCLCCFKRKNLTVSKCSYTYAYDEIMRKIQASIEADKNGKIVSSDNDKKKGPQKNRSSSISKSDKDKKNKKSSADKK